MNPQTRAQSVKDHAVRLGFDTAGIADLSPIPHAESLKAWLAAGMAGTMSYMHRQADRRSHPATILPGATRAVVVTRNYFQPDPPERKSSGLVAKYARGTDYHTALRAPLAALAAHVRSLGSERTVATPYIDAGPVPERELAQRAGLGWIGKNTMLIDPHRGSFFFIGVILTDLDLALDLPFEADRCGSCRRCLDACPTEAFPAERVLDSRRCISYLTIEHRDSVEPDLANQMGNRVFGCDICQDVCPWNVSFASESSDDLLRDPDLALIDLEQLVQMTDQGFAERYGATALERPGASGMRRNARIVLANGERAGTCPTP